MTFLIISDLHLTPKFDPRLFIFLTKTFQSCDQIILNGDFWDHAVCNFNDFLNSRWQQLFPLLLAKKTIYITGNHDLPVWLSDQTNQFCLQTLGHFSLRIGNHQYLIEHGHRFYPNFGEKHPWLVNDLTVKIAYAAINFGIQLMGPAFIKIFLHDAVKADQLMKIWASKHLSCHQTLVCGHTHIPIFQPQHHYLNSGFVQASYASYLLFENGQPRLVQTRY